MNKDKILDALNAIQNGSDAGEFHDELEAVIGILIETSEETIAAVVQDIHGDNANQQN
ncbi:MAG: hypothetical protein FWF05_09560 [Oscillospiraceae bacterium]|nr:hypothetical protein [Oscillospiraceae bacterium]